MAHTFLFLFGDSEPSGVTNRKAVPVAFTVYCGRGHLYRDRQLSGICVYMTSDLLAVLGLVSPGFSAAFKFVLVY